MFYPVQWTYDEKLSAERHTDPGTTFDANLRKFVNETKTGIPVLSIPPTSAIRLTRFGLIGGILGASSLML